MLNQIDPTPQARLGGDFPTPCSSPMPQQARFLPSAPLSEGIEDTDGPSRICTETLSSFSNGSYVGQFSREAGASPEDLPTWAFPVSAFGISKGMPPLMGPRVMGGGRVAGLPPTGGPVYHPL
jgi:hypothetical protein